MRQKGSRENDICEAAFLEGKNVKVTTRTNRHKLFLIIFLFYSQLSSQGDNYQMEHSSFTTTPIYLFKENKIISQGTGVFLAQNNEKETLAFLFTNYHVLTGHSPDSPNIYEGDKIQFIIHEDTNNPRLIRIITMPLFTKSNIPIWLKSNKYPNADVSAIWLPAIIFHDIIANVITTKSFDKNMIKRPTSKITIVGYPYNFFDTTNYLPIYKTGNIASEPDIDFSGNPYFLVDASIFPGMSGSPVFLISDGAWLDKDGNMKGGYEREFLGIFSSGQIHKEFLLLQKVMNNQPLIGIEQTTSLELGFVWKTKVIKDIIEGFNIDDYRQIIKPSDIYYQETKSY